MASCKDCIHERVCVIKAFPDAFENTEWSKEPCDHFESKSEGEWIKHPCSYECTLCGEEFCVESYAEDYDPITDYDLHYCPNCGAKMKGGAE